VGVIRLLAAAALLVGLAAVPARAQSLDPASQDALDQTLRMLLDPGARSGEVSRSTQGAAVDQQVRALAGSEALTQEVYALAGQVLSELVQSTGGDTQKMLQALDRAKTDPAGFAALLSPETQQRLRELAVKLSDKPR
jgi:hypothetical protein